MRKLVAASIYPMVVGYSTILTVVFTYPFLFSVGLKADLFRIASLDVYSAMAFADTTFFGATRRMTIGRHMITQVIRRERLLEDGIRLLMDFGPGPVQIDLIFDEEKGFGSGLIYEFVDLFAKELARSASNMWRSTVDGEFAFTKIGLFPSPFADPKMFYILGLLCGKALSMPAALPLPFSAQFFRFLDGEKLTLEDVDDELAHSIYDRESIIVAQCPFTYPGRDDVVLIPGGESMIVNESNYDQFVELVTDFTCGSRLLPIKKNFLRGLFSVIENGVWDRLTAQEKVLLLIGDSQELSMRDLEVNIGFEHGYDEQCAQRTMLFETICEFDPTQKEKLFQFITGNERLPVGGLGALRPKIMVAKRVGEEGQTPDQTLPTASTCTHYFKLPPYSSKKVLKNKLLLAITEGSVGFDLS
jgi:E3 ubiquitin-protein ligase TRIP12